MHTFETPHPVSLKVELWQGQVTVHAADTTTSTVELEALGNDSAAQEMIDNTTVEQRGDELVVLMPKIRGGLFRRQGDVMATITVPTHSSAKIETASADVDTHGELGDLKISTGSGDLELDTVASADLKTGSGDVELRTARGNCSVKGGSSDISLDEVGGHADILAGSGDVVVGQIGGTLKIKTGSGDIVVKHAGDGVDAMAGSGDLLVRRIDHGKLKAKTGSGDVTVGVADGTAAYLDITTVTGDVTSSLDASDAPGDGDQTVELIIQAGTGDVVLQRA